MSHTVDKYHTKTSTDNPFWFICICTLLILSNLSIVVALIPYGGWDTNVYCNAVNISDKNLNPYDRNVMMQETGCNFPLPYPPLVLPFFEMLCANGGYWSFIILYLITSYFTFLSLRNKKDKENALYFATILISGFHAFLTSTISGNIALLEMFFFSLALSNLQTHKHHYTGIFFGILSFFKLQPIVIVLTAIFFLNNTNLIKSALWLLGSLIFMYSVCFLTQENNSVFYYQFVKNNLLGAGSGAINEGMEFYNVSFLEMSKDVAVRLLGINESFGSLFYLLFVAIFGLFALIYKTIKRKSNNIILFFVLLSILTIPRLKDYSYSISIPLLCLISRDFTYKQKCILLTTCSIIPCLSYIMIRAQSNTYSSPTVSQLRMIWHLYYLPICLLATILCIGVILSRNKITHYE